MRSIALAVTLCCLSITSCSNAEESDGDALATLCRDFENGVLLGIANTTTKDELLAVEADLVSDAEAILAADDPGGWTEEEQADIVRCASAALVLQIEIDRRS